MEKLLKILIENVVFIFTNTHTRKDKKKFAGSFILFLFSCKLPCQLKRNMKYLQNLLLKYKYGKKIKKKKILTIFVKAC